jgi:hypothetical protein
LGANRYSFHRGVYLRALGQELTPPFFRCPVQVTLDQIAPDPAYVDRISDFEERSLSTSDRIGAIAAAVETYAIPWLEAHSTIRGLKTLVVIDRDALLPRVLMWRVTYDYLRGSNGAAYQRLHPTAAGPQATYFETIREPPQVSRIPLGGNDTSIRSSDGRMDTASRSRARLPVWLGQRATSNPRL